jgi:acyl-CoA synthetase (AMP-forming)/AMP-acid ligase II
MFVNRDCIGDDIIFDDYTKDTICFTINRIKNMLRDAGATKGDLVTISIMRVSMEHVASLFACAEMGLKIIILDSPATIESLPFTKLALHGPSKYYIHDSQEDTTKIYNGLHDEMIRRYGGKSIDIRDDSSTEDFYVEVSSDDPLLLSSTSGTTKASRPVLFSHKEVYAISKRNINVFDFEPSSFVCHSRNLHHASALLTSLFPSLMGSQRHFNIAIGHDLSGEDLLLLQGYRWIHNINTTHIMIPNKATLIDFLETINEPFKRTLNINMCGFALDQEFVELAEKYNVRFQSHYGSIDTAIPLLVNFVDKDSVVKENGLGVLADDFYQFDGKEVRCELWDEPRYIEDDLTFDGQFFIEPRDLPEVPDDVDLEPFYQDTKINFEQLRGYLKKVKKSA